MFKTNTLSRMYKSGFMASKGRHTTGIAASDAMQVMAIQNFACRSSVENRVIKSLSVVLLSMVYNNHYYVCDGFKMLNQLEVVLT